MLVMVLFCKPLVVLRRLIFRMLLSIELTYMCNAKEVGNSDSSGNEIGDRNRDAKTNLLAEDKGDNDKQIEGPGQKGNQICVFSRTFFCP